MNSVPKISRNLCWTSEDELIYIIIRNKGVLNSLLQKIINKPKKSIIYLDEIGSFIWQRIDGVKTTEQIATELEKNFGNKAKPINERLIKYLKILSEYKFITFI